MNNVKNQVVRSVAAGLAVAVCLWPVAGSAQPLSTSAVTVEHARDAFMGAGYQVDQPRSWDWMSPPVTSFQVHDAAYGRVLMVLVYPTADAAEAGRSLAQVHENEQYPGAVALSGYGPHLLIGYGQSMWRGNIALMQTTQAELDRRFQVQNDRNSNVYVEAAEVVQPAVATRFAVDLDFQQALQDVISL